MILDQVWVEEWGEHCIRDNAAKAMYLKSGQVYADWILQTAVFESENVS